jgi:hypothetical protein
MMTQRGWTRAVAVNVPEATVMVYLPANPGHGAERVCFAVCDGEHLVVGAGTIDLGPLAQFAADHRLLAKF